jgi:hypothetical protein
MFVLEFGAAEASRMPSQRSAIEHAHCGDFFSAAIRLRSAAGGNRFAPIGFFEIRLNENRPIGSGPGVKS